MTRSLAVTAVAFACSFAPSVEAQNSPMQHEQQPSIVIERQFEQAPQLVWKAWTDPEWVAGWVGSDPKGSVRKVSTAVQVGGQYEFTFADSDGTEHTARGVYSEVAPYRKLAFSWSWASEPGIETAVVVELAPQGEGTLMRFEHGGLTHVSTHDYASGWRSTFEKMEKTIERNTQEHRRDH